MSRKTEQLIAAVSNKPIKIAEAYRLAGTTQVKKLIDSACLTKYVDENPDYATCVIGGQKPMCFWVKLGDVKHVPP